MTTPNQPDQTDAPRRFTWYNCKQEQMVVSGHRIDGKCHQCVEIVYLIESSAFEEKCEELQRVKDQNDRLRILCELEEIKELRGELQRSQERVIELESALAKTIYECGADLCNFPKCKCHDDTKKALGGGE